MGIERQLDISAVWAWRVGALDSTADWQSSRLLGAAISTVAADPARRANGFNSHPTPRLEAEYERAMRATHGKIDRGGDESEDSGCTLHGAK